MKKIKYEIQIKDNDNDKYVELASCPLWSVNDAFDALVKKFPRDAFRVMSSDGDLYGVYEPNGRYVVGL